MSVFTRRSTVAGTATPLQLIAMVVGAVFLVVGVLGFVPGITTHYGAMEFAGHHSGAKLIGIFQVSVLHNIVHLAFGVAGLALSRRYSSAFAYLVGGGALYLVIWLYGMVVDKATPANFVPVNGADDWLHLVLGLAMVALGFAGRQIGTRRRSLRDAL